MKESTKIIIIALILLLGLNVVTGYYLWDWRSKALDSYQDSLKFSSRCAEKAERIRTLERNRIDIKISIDDLNELTLFDIKEKVYREAMEIERKRFEELGKRFLEQDMTTFGWIDIKDFDEREKERVKKLKKLWLKMAEIY